MSQEIPFSSWQFQVVPCLSLAGLNQPERPLSITSYQTVFLLFETTGLLKLAGVLSSIARHVSLCSHPIAFKEICEEGSVIGLTG